MEGVEQLSSTPRLSGLEKLVLEMEQMAPMISPDLVEQLRECLASLPSKLSADESLQAWRLSYCIWNSCVDIANNLQSGVELDENHARLRQIASDLLFLAGDIDGIDSSVDMAAFFHRTGVIWHRLKNFTLAAACLEKAAEMMSKFVEEQERKDVPRSEEELEFMFDLLVARSQTAWELSYESFACGVSEGKDLLAVLPEHQIQLAKHYLECGKSLLAKEDTVSHAHGIKYLEQALVFASTTVKCSNAEVSGKDLIGSLKIMILRYLAAGHLHRENFETVLKYLADLKSAGAPEDSSTPYLAVKALAGLDRYEEAEKELFVLIRQTGPNMEEFCMSGIESVLRDPNRLEACKRAFLILQSRYPSDKSLPARILEYVLNPRRLPDVDLNKKDRLEVALEIANNYEVLATTTGVLHGGIQELRLEDERCSSEEQEYIHALLWNSGSEQYHAKQYDVCIKFLETSMLYLPRNLGSNLQRAKSLRALCHCALALRQYDRADEYVTEAEQINPNVSCAILKFNIYLQANYEEEEAAQQVEKLLRCPDFAPEHLLGAFHKALTYNCLKAAICALSTYLGLPIERRSKGLKDVVVISNIVHHALQDPEQRYRAEALQHLKEAQARLASVGFDKFFGAGELGPKEADWFASTAWDQGLFSLRADDDQFAAAADFFSCASDFCGSLPKSEENLRYVQKSLLLSMSSLLASNCGDKGMKSASRMLENCRKVYRALAASKDATETEDDSSEIDLSLLASQLQARQKGKTPGESGEVASTGYTLVIKLVLNSSAPDYKLVATIVRKLIVLADQRCKDGSDGSEVMAEYKHAKEILAGLSPGKYPLEELQWLVLTSWNRAGNEIELLRFSQAVAWMEVALEIANHDPQMEIPNKPSMIEYLNEVRSAILDTD